MEKYLITVIVPMYNAEKYISKTIETVINQTYKKIELILVDDGSTDETVSICNDYSKIDKRIKLVMQKKLGVSKARNRGIKLAKGKFICFVDADDYVEINMLEEFIKIYNNYKSDLIISGYFSEVDINNKITFDRICIKEKNYENIEEIRKDFVQMWDKHLLYNIWNKLYNKDIIDKYNIKFPSYDWGEDIEFNREYLLKINTLYNTEKCFYHYIRGRNETITGKYISNLYDIRLKEDKEFREYFEKYNIEYKEYNEFCARRHIERTLGCIENLFNKNCKMTLMQKYTEVKRIINDKKTRKYLKEIKPNSKKMKILLIPYKLRLVVMSMIMGKVLSIIKQSMPEIFNRIKK